ncbi:uncharacterized protein TRAVEDRAFT_121592, partial [Trametes versicolor FP-101664 SS1]|uniref:uncharacterized protein n=1 Tax=Trametes versicolor (strain FP-101664) TaxID=717944 RepID=UPI00046213F7
PVSFASGPLGGFTVRVELDEIQKADLGRKCARKDKRPLDPPPVVLCSFINLNTRSTSAARLREQTLDVETASVGSVCHVDLFPVPANYEHYFPPANSDLQALPPIFFQHRPDGMHLSANPGSCNLFPLSFVMQGLLPPASRFGARVTGITSRHSSLLAPSYSSTSAEHLINTPTSSYPAPLSAVREGAILQGVGVGVHDGDAGQTQAVESDDSKIVAWFRSFPIYEGSKSSAQLAGSTFVQAELVHYNGKKQVMFVFADLSVKVEGTFILRYRTMNLASPAAAAQPFSILAECYGGPFRVYSTKDFPGLPASTALTKLLSFHSIHVEMHEKDRKRRTKSQIDAAVRERGGPLARRGAPRTASTAGPSSSLPTALYSSVVSPAAPAESAAAHSYYPPPGGGAAWVPAWVRPQPAPRDGQGREQRGVLLNVRTTATLQAFSPSAHYLRLCQRFLSACNAGCRSHHCLVDVR